MPSTCILIVGNDSRQRDVLHDTLAEADYTVMSAADCEDAVRRTRRHAPAVALVDLWMADVPGHLAIHAIRRAETNTECIGIMSHAAQQNVAEEALRLGAFTVLRRPFDRAQLLASVQRAIERRTTRASLEAVKTRLAVLFDSLPVGVLIVDDRTRVVVDANPAAARIMNVDKKEIVGALCHNQELREPGQSEQAAAPATPSGTESPRTLARLPATTTAATISLNGRAHRVECFVDASGRLEIEDELSRCLAVNELLTGDTEDILVTVDADGKTHTIHYLPRHLRDSVLPGGVLEAVLPKAFRIPFREALAEVLANGKPQGFTRGQPPLEAWAISLNPVTSRGKVIGAAVRLRDLSEATWQDKQLGARSIAADHMEQFLLVLDASGHITDVNTTACRRLEYTRSELLTVAYDAIDHPEEPHSWSQLWAQVRKEHHLTHESIYRTRAGDRIPVQVRLEHTILEGTHFCVCLARDVAAQRAREVALQSGTTRQRALFDGLDSAALLLARDGRILAGNSQAAALLHTTPDKLLTTHYFDHLPDALSKTRRVRIEEAFTRNHPLHFEDTHGNAREAHSLTPVPGAEGGSPELVLITRDISAAQSSEGTLHALWDNSPYPLLELDLTRIRHLFRAEDNALSASPREALAASPDLARSLRDAIRFVNANAMGLALLGMMDMDALVRHGAECFESTLPLFGELLGEMHAGTHIVEGALTLKPKDKDDPVRVTIRLLANARLPEPWRQVTAILVDDDALRRVQRELLQCSLRERQRIGGELESAILPPLEKALALADTLADKGDETAATELRDALQAATEQLRGVSSGLARGEELETSLIAALQDLSSSAERSYGITCRCNISAKGLGHNRVLATHLFLMARDALDIAIRRHGAKAVSISLTASRGESVLAITDNGHAPLETDEGDVAEAQLRIHAQFINATYRRTRSAANGNQVTCTFRSA